MFTVHLLQWRRRRDSNPRDPFESNGFQDRRIQPLCHSSAFNYNVICGLDGHLWQLSICAAAFWCNCHQIVTNARQFRYRGSLRLEICVRITHGYGDCPISTPRSSNRDANVCRSVCQETSEIPAFLQAKEESAFRSTNFSLVPWL